MSVCGTPIKLSRRFPDPCRHFPEAHRTPRLAALPRIARFFNSVPELDEGFIVPAFFHVFFSGFEISLGAFRTGRSQYRQGRGKNKNRCAAYEATS